MELTALLQLISAAVTVYNGAQGKPVNAETKALVTALPGVINAAKSLLSKPEFRTQAWQLKLAMDSEAIREAIGVDPAPETTTVQE